MIKKRITLFYKNGEIHEFYQEATEEQFESIAEVVNASFMEGIDSVLRLNSEAEANFIRLTDVSRVVFEHIE